MLVARSISSYHIYSLCWKLEGNATETVINSIGLLRMISLISDLQNLNLQSKYLHPIQENLFKSGLNKELNIDGHFWGLLSILDND